MLKRVSKVLLDNSRVLPKPNLLFSTAAQPEIQERLQTFRTTENDPLKHTIEHNAQYYTISNADKEQLFAHGGLPKTFLIQAKTFNETCLMIRQPSLDIINCIENIDYSKPAVRFVMYGKMGTGKSLSLAHVLHYAFKKGFLLVHVPWVGQWMRRCKERSDSESKPGYSDLNLDAASWLIHFKHQNSHILSRPEIKTTQDYVWNKREKTTEGSTILELIDFGVNRLKYASDTIVALCQEVKSLSDNGVCKTLVAIDGFNAFFYPHTRVFGERKVVIHPQNITITEGFMNITKFDWKNAAIIVTLDEIAIAEKDQINHLPR